MAAGVALSRRRLLALAGVAGLGVLSGCGTGQDQRVSFLNWQDYIDPTLLPDFETASGLSVGYETYDSNDALAKRLAAADVTRKAGRKTTTFDLIVPSDNLFRQLREAGGLQELDGDIVTAALLKNLAPEMRAIPADPGNRYSVPWATGTTGIAYDTTVFRTPPTWEVFLDVAHKGKMTMLDEMREAYAAALFAQGESPNTTNPNAVNGAKSLLINMKENVEFNSATYLDDLAEGRLVAAQGFSTDVLQARRRNPNLAFVIPEAGGTRWIDLLCIPADAPNPDGANELIAFYLDPRVSAANSAYNLVDTGNEAAREFVPDDVLDNPVVYPPEDVVERLVFLEPLSKDDLALYEAGWKQVKEA